MSFYEGPRGQLRRQVAALERLENFPQSPRFIGRFCAGVVSATVPGVGWSTRLAEVEAGEGQGEVEIDDAIVERHEGKTVRVDGEDVAVAMRALRRPQGVGGNRVGPQRARGVNVT